jgi:hypothetical protein
MGGFALIFGIVPIVVIVIVIMATSVRILRDYESAVIFRFGRRANAVVNPGGDGSGPWLVLLMPFIDKMVRVSLRTITTDVPPQDVITRDNVSVKGCREGGDQRARLPLRDVPDDADYPAERAGPAGAGRPPGLAREDQPGAHADHRPAHQPVGGSR